MMLYNFGNNEFMTHVKISIGALLLILGFVLFIDKMTSLVLDYILPTIGFRIYIVFDKGYLRLWSHTLYMTMTKMHC